MIAVGNDTPFPGVNPSDHILTTLTTPFSAPAAAMKRDLLGMWQTKNSAKAIRLNLGGTHRLGNRGWQSNAMQQWHTLH